MTAGAGCQTSARERIIPHAQQAPAPSSAPAASANQSCDVGAFEPARTTGATRRSRRTPLAIAQARRGHAQRWRPTHRRPPARAPDGDGQAHVAQRMALLVGDLRWQRRRRLRGQTTKISAMQAATGAQTTGERSAAASARCQRRSDVAQQRQRIQQPAEQHRRPDERAEQLGAERQLLCAARRASAPRRRSRRTAEKTHEQAEVAGRVHHLRLYFLPDGDVERVERGEHVEQSRRRSRRCCLLVGDRGSRCPAPTPASLATKLRQADADDRRSPARPTSSSSN